MINVDDKKVMMMFKELTSNEQKKVFRNAIQKSLVVIKKRAEANLKASVKHVNRVDKWGNTLKKGIKIRVGKDALAGKVHIMGNFKLKFFQNGTNERRIKHYRKIRYAKGTGAKRGAIRATHFFTNAINSEQQKVLNNLDTLVKQSIEKINKKYQ